MKFNTRSYHNSPETLEILSGLPSWMNMTSNTQSVGFQVFNAILGIEAERIRKLGTWIHNNVFSATAYINEMPYYYKSVINKLAPETTTIYGQGYINGNNTTGRISIDVVDNEVDWVYVQPTRISYVSRTPFVGDIRGIEYVENHPTYPTGVILATYVQPDPTGYNVVTTAENGIQLTREAKGVEYQQFSYQGYDEILRPETSGYLWSEYGSANTNPYGKNVFNVSRGEFEHTPVPGTVHMYDILNLDSSGNATEIKSTGTQSYRNSATNYVGYDTNLGNPHLLTSWSITGTVWEFINPFSHYMTTYAYKSSNNPKFMCPRSKTAYISNYSSLMTFTSEDPDYTGTELPFGIAQSTGNLGLCVDPILLRPGRPVTMGFSYTNVATGVWPKPATTQFTMTISDANFTKTSSDAVHIFYGNNDLWPRDKYVYSPVVDGSTITIDPTGLYHMGTYMDGPLDVKVMYNADTSILATGVQSYSGLNSNIPYPDDYKIVTFGIGNNSRQYIKPYTVVPVKHDTPSVYALMSSGNLKQYSLSTTKEYVGIAYSSEAETLERTPNRASIYVLERFNHVLEKRRAEDNTILEKYALFCPEPQASGYTTSVIPANMTLIKEEDTVGKDGRAHKQYTYRDNRGTETIKSDTKYFPLLSYEMHPRVSETAERHYANGLIYRDIRGMTEYAGRIYVAASVDPAGTWPQPYGGYISIGSSGITNGYLYPFDYDALSSGPDAIPAAPEADAFLLGTGCPNPLGVSLNKDENILVANGIQDASGEIRTYRLHYDYAYIQPNESANKSTIYMREAYTSLEDI